jgi:hypothetical protein
MERNSLRVIASPSQGLIETGLGTGAAQPGSHQLRLSVRRLPAGLSQIRPLPRRFGTAGSREQSKWSEGEENLFNEAGVFRLPNASTSEARCGGDGVVYIMRG